jgi:Family of unknown function (DUF6318)
MPGSRFVPDVAPSRLVGVALAVTMAVGLLGGCSFARAEPSATSTSAGPTVAASPTLVATPSPTTTPKPERPAAMDAATVDGAVAAVTYFMELYPYAYNTGDVTQLKELSHPECIFCKSVTDHAQQMHMRGEHQEGTTTRVLSSHGTEVNPGYWFSVDARVQQGGWQVLDAGGRVVESDLATKTYAMNFAVIHQDGHWIVRESDNTRG